MSNFARAIKALNDVDEALAHLADNESYVSTLKTAGLLMPDDMITEYGVWWQLPNEEGISWERDEADLTQMLKNLRKHGYKAEKVARFVSPHRFITLTEEPK